MIGIIVLGHSHFGEEMLNIISSMESVQRNIAYVDYRKKEGDTPEAFAERVRQAAGALEPNTQGILIFTDSARGTPYKTALHFAETCSQCPVITVTGTNLPGLIETAMARMYISDIDVLADLAVEHGKKQIMRFGGAMPIPR